MVYQLQMSMDYRTKRSPLRIGRHSQTNSHQFHDFLWKQLQFCFVFEIKSAFCFHLKTVQKFLNRRSRVSGELSSEPEQLFGKLFRTLYTDNLRVVTNVSLCWFTVCIRMSVFEVSSVFEGVSVGLALRCRLRYLF